MGLFGRLGWSPDRDAGGGRRMEAESSGGSGLDPWDAAAAESMLPEHLVVMVNGIVGRYPSYQIWHFLLYHASLEWIIMS